VGYYMTTTVMAVILGIILVTTVRPGDLSTDIEEEDRAGESRNVTAVDTLLDLARNFFPENIIQATLQQYRTTLHFDPKDRRMNETNLYTWSMSGEYTQGTNILGLVAFSIVLGITLAMMEERGQPLIDFFTCLSEAMMKITTWVIWLAPVGVFFLITGQVLETPEMATVRKDNCKNPPHSVPPQVFAKLGKYFLTVLFGLFFHGFVVLPIVYTVCTRRLPFRFIANMTNAFTTAFGTASSSATLPVTINLLEEKNGVDPRVAR